jgi:hypothetical protein
MTNRDLKIGDRVRIVAVPGDGVPGYFMQSSTKRVFKKLIARNRPVRIFQIDEYGQPWYQCRFKRQNGDFEVHWLGILDGEDNWVPVRTRAL